MMGHYISFRRILDNEKGKPVFLMIAIPARFLYTYLLSASSRTQIQQDEMNMHSTHCIARKTALLLGISGILGSLTLLAGDMLFYYNGSQTDLIANMAAVSSQRIILSGLAALFATWLYVLGSGQIYYAFQPARRWLRLSVFLSFAAIMIAYGIVHGAYIAIATSAQNAAGLGLDPRALTELAIAANQALRQVTYLPFGIFTLLFIPAVWMKKTFYPRWIILFSPIILFLLNGVITNNLTGKLKTIIGGGYLNLLLLVFFSASTIALWLNRPRPEKISR
jgi:hypothetical protein